MKTIHSHDDLRLHFGLGTHKQAARITIYWPRGHVETLSEVKANQVLVIKEGSGLSAK